uniref:EpnL n=1 Tax=Streptomyces hygroscopicus TaxID=1912 RepID=V5RMV4_STRHY|nr:EpnL [Streptomyces hygroscopicus]
MSTQPEEAVAPPAPTAPAQIYAQLRTDHRADTWAPAFERDWAKALEDSRHSYSLTPLHNVIRTWQLRVAAASDVDSYMDSDEEEPGFVDLGFLHS